MHLAPLDVVFFVLFVAFVIGFAIYKSRKEKDSTDYFLAGRGATWPLIGCSLIAANISTEQFVGMSGQGAGATGLAIASYEWVAAVTLVFVAIFFLPRFLRAGIFTIPEYLEYRYNTAARMIMSFFLLIMFVFVTTVSVVYSGGVTLDTFFGDTPLPILGTISLQKGIWIVGIAAVIYTAFGGLKAVLYADLIQGTALIGGGAVVLMFTLKAMGGWSAAMAEPEIEKRMHMVLSSDHPVMPWTILILGIWIPNFYYWGLNQYITQRTLAAKTLREGQFGIIFAAALKLIIPFIIVVPGIMAPVLFREQLAGSTETAADQAYPLLIRELIGVGWRGFVLAALAGAVISSLASMLNSASTIFTMDLYKRIVNPKASQAVLVNLGRAMTVVFVIIACLMAPMLAQERFKGVFNYIQEFQGLFSPGILAAFVFGFVVRRAPAAAAISGMVACPIIYSAMKWPVSWILRARYTFESAKTTAAQAFAAADATPSALDRVLAYFMDMAFLDRMGITFILVLLVMGVVTAIKPLAQPVTMPVNQDFDMRPSRSVFTLGLVVIAATVALYVIFW